MTDSCYDENAEGECERCLTAALTHNAHSAEAYYLMASMRVSQQRNADALALLRKSHAIWKAKAEQMMRVTQGEGMSQRERGRGGESRRVGRRGEREQKMY